MTSATPAAGQSEGQLIRRVRELLARAEGLCQNAGAREVEARVRTARERLDEPLRVAIVGRVKAGKSTLLNALVGEFVAATDAAECTKIVTWYDHGNAYRAFKLFHNGAAQPATLRRDERSAHIELDGSSLADVARLSVEFPSPWLNDLTLIDTPGIASLTEDAAARTTSMIESQDRQRVDAVIYLMRNLHQEDFRFLDSFNDRSIQPVGPINSVAVLSRADEVGSGRTDALDQAHALADQWRRHPMLRPLAMTVLPVAGLLAESAATLRQDEFEAFKHLAAAPIEVVHHLVRSVDDFTSPHAPPVIALEARVRAALLDRYGLYGVRVAISMLRHDVVSSADELAQSLFDSSGVGKLRTAVLQQFSDRRDVIKAANALDDVDELIDQVPALAALEREIEQIRVNAVELEELRLLTQLRVDPDPEVSSRQLSEIERLLGVEGRSLTERLGMGAEATTEMVRARASIELDRWRTIHTDLSQAPLLRRVAETIERLLGQALIQMHGST